jgi:ribosomal protein L7Ae-like RNA K-turn-binding protein
MIDTELTRVKIEAHSGAARLVPMAEDVDPPLMASK